MFCSALVSTGMYGLYSVIIVGVGLIVVLHIDLIIVFFETTLQAVQIV
jgi:hypothetical protein